MHTEHCGPCGGLGRDDYGKTCLYCEGTGITKLTWDEYESRERRKRETEEEWERTAPARAAAANKLSVKRGWLHVPFGAILGFFVGCCRGCTELSHFHLIAPKGLDDWGVVFISLVVGSLIGFGWGYIGD